MIGVYNMALANSIRMMLIKRGNISEAELARRMELSPQNFNNKMKRDNFTEKDLRDIAAALNCTASFVFQMNDTGEMYHLTENCIEEIKATKE